jgi:hypothetical protein
MDEARRLKLSFPDILTEDEIADGVDELGVLLYGDGRNAYRRFPSKRHARSSLLSRRAIYRSGADPDDMKK